MSTVVDHEDVFVIPPSKVTDIWTNAKLKSAMLEHL